MSSSEELRRAIMETSQQLGINPVDLATVYSYETAGTFDPWKKGPTTKWGTHRGLIQWGEPQQQKYGVSKDTPIADQVRASGRYLKDAGVRPGHGLLDVYSAVNAGRVGLYNRSDAAAGGAPGTVRDKVVNQMGPHQAKALKLLNGGDAPAAVPVAVAATPGTVPARTVPVAPVETGAVPTFATQLAANTPQTPVTVTPAVETVNPFDGLMDMFAVAQMQQKQAVPVVTASAPEAAPEIDPEEQTALTSQTPNVYINRMRRRMV